MTTPYLPANDPFPLVRKVELAVARFRYAYRTADDDVVRPVAAASRFPVRREIYNLSWGLRHLPLVIAAQVNRMVKHPLLSVLDRIEGPTSLRPFDVIAGSYHRVDPIVMEYQDDGLFAWRRVAGACPLVIERVRDRPRLTALMKDLDDATFQAVTGATETLDGAIAGNRLFVCDYAPLLRALRPVQANVGHDSRFRGKYLPAPVLVLYDRPGIAPADHALTPVAITVDQPGPVPSPMFTPRDGLAWQVAKTYVEVADNNWHFGIGHLYRGHYVMEAFALAARRNLSRRHPLAVLLEPHLRFTLFTNVVAYGYFANSGKLYDRMYAGSLEESRLLMSGSAASGMTPLDHLPSRDLAKRGMDVGLGAYPWRDDALAWEQAVRSFVSNFVALYYPSSAHVAADEELMRFRDDVLAPGASNLRGVFALPDLPSLVETLTLAVYSAGPGHSAMHFPMWDLYTYAPTNCEAAYAPPPRTVAEVDAKRFRDTLPSPSEALENFFQVEIGQFRYDVFGDYDEYDLASVAAAAPAIASLRSSLAALAQTIEAREQAASHRAYPYLHPSLVTNSVNI